MLYLAKVSQHNDAGDVVLQLLARQRSEYHWSLSQNQSSITVSCKEFSYAVGSLVLVDLTRDRQVELVEDATNWILSVIEKYLLKGISPNVLHEEADRAEEWRKDLTLKTQDLARRALELETRRDQIQELEKKLEVERQQLETIRLKKDGNHSEENSAEVEHNGEEESAHADAF